MRSGTLMLGASAITLAASAAAQTTVVGTNQSSLSQAGTDNVAQVSNAAPGNDDNVSAVVQNGRSNTATVEQIGDVNIARIRQSGDRNTARHRQEGDRNSGETDQLGNDHLSGIVQHGRDNLGLALQNNGDQNDSYIAQGSTSGAAAPGNFNTARVQQQGSRNKSNVFQVAGGSTSSLSTAPGVTVSDNFARVVQGDANLVLSHGATSMISQSSRGNSATVAMFEGTIQAVNESSIVQGHNEAWATEQPGPETLSRNRALAAIRGYANRSIIEQNGIDNDADVTMLGGKLGTPGGDYSSSLSIGNVSRVIQEGTEHSAVVVTGSAFPSEGWGNSSQVVQLGNNHYAEAWQRGLHDVSSVRQGNASLNKNITYSDGAPARAFATVAQRSERGRVVLAQDGDVAAEVTQGLGARSEVTVQQIDTGDLGITNNVFDPVNRARNQVGIAQYGDLQVAVVRQFAMNASATVYQQSGRPDSRSNRNFVLVQQGLSDTTLVAGEERPNDQFFGKTLEGGPNSRNLTASVSQGNGASPVAHNRAVIRQDGLTLSAAIEQAGTGAADAPNRIEIAHRGSDNRAAAIQRARVGPSGTGAPASGQSGDEFHFAGGRRSAEILILQKNTGNDATVEQRGLGQLARIEQSGAKNSASILQEAGATNATALIRQTGSFNSYSVTQSQAGQYIAVSQTGNNNAVTTVVQRPAS